MWKDSLERKLISQGLVMQWRRKAGVTKFTDGLKKRSEKCDDQVKTFEESDGEGEEKKADLTKFTNSDGNEMKPTCRRGVKKPFYSAEMRNRVLSHYRYR